MTRTNLNNKKRIKVVVSRYQQFASANGVAVVVVVAADWRSWRRPSVGLTSELSRRLSRFSWFVPQIVN